MKKSFLILSLFVGATVLLTSCKDEPEEPTPQPTKTELLSEHAWLITDVTNNGTSIFNSFDACIQDNSFTFYADGNGITDEEASKCDAADPQHYVFTWLFSNSQDKLVWKNPGQTDTFNIVKLQSGMMELSLKFNVGNTLVYKLEHQ